jgi:hypothetical protein
MPIHGNTRAETPIKRTCNHFNYYLLPQFPAWGSSRQQRLCLNAMRALAAGILCVVAHKKVILTWGSPWPTIVWLHRVRRVMQQECEKGGQVTNVGSNGTTSVLTPQQSQANVPQ